MKFAVIKMKVLSSVVAISLLSAVASNGTNLTGREGDITPHLNNTVAYTIREGTLLKRGNDFDGSFCGRRLVYFKPMNRGENSNNDYDFTSDNDINEAPQLDKILGGTYATYGEFPYQVAIWYEKEYICSGAIINEFWVLTAGHCLFDRPDLSSFLVSAGDHRLSYANAYEEDFKVDKTILHELYNDDPLDFDIGMIKIKAGRYREGFRFNDHVQPVCLANIYENPLAGDRLTVTGWGYTFKDSGDSDVLKKTILPVLNYGICNKWFPGMITAGTFCAGYVDGDTEPCQGDSGAPATARDGNLDVAISLDIILTVGDIAEEMECPTRKCTREDRRMVPHLVCSRNRQLAYL